MKYIFFAIYVLFSLSVNSEDMSDIKLTDLVKLQKESIIEKLIDKKLLGIYSSEDKFLEIHYSDGSYYISDEESEYDGRWKIENNQICYLYDIDDEFSCVNIMTNSKNEIFYVDDEGGVYAKITSIQDELIIEESELLHPSMELLIKKNELFYTGDILITTYHKIHSALKKNMDIKTLVIDSYGGDVEVANDIADLIIDYNLNTRTTSYCISACTVIFLGGNKRILDRGGKIGFHQSYFHAEDIENWYNNVEDQYENIYHFIASLYADTQEDIFKDLQFFLERGVNPYFAIKSMQAKSDSMWYPRRKEMLDANFITE
ncbi:MAG: ATP-dependent Clp protease proteolytic subunit [SAR202 cluster bacterium]|jgi:ATP-dependent protease ClpP protease subunit|nr:ATP-dependent Clp protease proteolytic subunit [SAR202 cluster bacterium]|tara:strand:+ start:929 stop:1879 length:951 start_codon:yes stop_codon:yes gene_type:complete